MTRATPIPSWHFSGLSIEHYSAGLDSEIYHQGSQSARLQAISETAPGSASIQQKIDASNYRNCRIKFSAFIKTENVEHRCGLYLSASTHSYPEELDDMSNRSLSSTSDWQQYSAVIDVSNSNRTIHFGIYLSGTGSVWLDTASLEIVREEVPSTSLSRTRFEHKSSKPVEKELGTANIGTEYEDLPKSPQNMDFEKRID